MMVNLTTSHTKKKRERNIEMMVVNEMDKQMRKFVENLNGKGWFTRFNGTSKMLEVLKFEGEQVYVFKIHKRDGVIDCHATRIDEYGFIDTINANSNRFEDIITYLELIYQNWHGYKINFIESEVK